MALETRNGGAMALDPGLTGPVNESVAPEQEQPIEVPSMPSIQIPVDEQMQRLLVEIVLDDFNKAKGDRLQINYGTTSKGETLRFDKWLKDIKDLYNAKRIPKTIPWKFCSNRSMRIAASILDMICSR